MRRPGDKICERCKEVNFASRTVCRKCNSSLISFGSREHMSSNQELKNERSGNQNNSSNTTTSATTLQSLREKEIGIV